MMMFIWMCVMAQAFFPGADRIVALQAQAYEAHLRAELETPAPTSALFGAAGHVTRYAQPKLSQML
jgi:hypothetical protein